MHECVRTHACVRMLWQASRSIAVAPWSGREEEEVALQAQGLLSARSKSFNLKEAKSEMTPQDLGLKPFFPFPPSVLKSSNLERALLWR